MTRKHTRRRVVVPLPPRGLREKLNGSSLTTLAIAHMTNLDEICRGTANVQTMWDLCGAVFTWSHAAQMLPPGHLVSIYQPGADEAQDVVATEAMVAQLDLAAKVVERYHRTGRIGFSGPEYQLAKLGVQIMDRLAERIDLASAKVAADWSEATLDRLVAEARKQPRRAA